MGTLATRLVLCLALVLAGIAPSAGITYGLPDGETHPGVGLILYRQEFPHPDLGTYIVNWGFCSGTLIAPDVFLTAAHCVYGEEPNLPILWVSFDTDYSLFEVPAWPDWPEPDPNHPRVRVRSIVVNPDFRNWPEGKNEGNADIAALILDLATATGPLPAPADLAPAGILDRLHDAHTLHGRRFTAVGYGQEVEFGGGPPAFTDPYVRRAAESEFLALGPAYIVLSQNPARDDGGTCYGDSGGPNFLRLDDGREVVAAITVTGDSVCRATNVDARVDTGNARAFLATVPGLVLP